MSAEDDETQVTVSGTVVSIVVDIDDAAVAGQLRDRDGAARVMAIRRMLAVGARGLATMGMSASIDEVGREVERVLAATGGAAEARVTGVLDAGSRLLEASFDPDRRDSPVARTLAEFSEINETLVERIGALLGPEGMLEDRLNSALDLNADDSPVARLQREVTTQLRDLRDLIVADEARRREAERGTQKGFAFEDRVEQALRAEAQRMGGATVEATALSNGCLGADAKVGDFVVTLADGSRIVVEAKNAARITLRGGQGILDELDRAMANRTATSAICVASREAFPGEVGPFGVFGNRVLVVDDGDGILLGAALRWVAADGGVTRGAAVRDAAEVAAQIERIREMATRISTSKRALAGIRTSVDQVRNDLDGLRGDLLDAVDAAARRLAVTGHTIEAA